MALRGARDAGDELLRALESPSSLVRNAAAASVFGSEHVRERLAALLSDDRADVRAAAARAFAHGVWSAEEFTGVEQERLAGLLADPVPEVRAAAAGALRHPKLPEPLRVRLVGLLEDGDPRVRLEAALSISHGIDRERARQVLESLTQSQVPLAVGWGERWLSTVGAQARWRLGVMQGTESGEEPRP